MPEQGSMGEAKARRRRVARAALAGFALLIVAVEVATFASRAATSSADRRAERYADASVSSGTKDYVELRAQVLEISPASATEAVRVTVVPHGRYAENGKELSEDLNLDANGYPGGSALLRAGEIPPPLMLSLDLTGDLSQYPFDSYRAVLAVNLRPVAYGTRVEVAVPTVLAVSSAKHDWSTGSSLVSATKRELVVELSASRGAASVGFALFELLVMVMLAGIAIAITYSTIVGGRDIEFSLFVWLVAMLFALPALRGTMPGVPAMGTVVDYAVFFWCLIAAASCLLVAAVTYIRAHRRDGDDEGDEGSVDLEV